MPRLIRRLHVDIDEICVVQRFESGICFPFIVGIVKSGGPGHYDRLHACIDGQSFDQVHGSNGCSGNPKPLPKSAHHRLFPRSPWPERIGGLFPLFSPLLIDRVLLQKRLGLLHKQVQQIGGSFSFCIDGPDRQFFPGRADIVMRRKALELEFSVGND